VSVDCLKILIAAGGTGGHVFPAIAIADEIRKMKPRTEFLFVGTKKKIESRIVPERGYAIAFIWISGFDRSIRPGTLLIPLKIAVSFVQSLFLICRFRPDVVVGTGGYVCGPVLFVASLLTIPTIIHESNSYPGITTRWLSARSTKIFVAFEATSQWLKRKDNVRVVGTPTRPGLGRISREDGLRFFHLDPAKKTVLVFGGSLGASSINQAMRIIVDRLARSGVQIIWQTGRSEPALANEMKQKNIGWVGSFIDAMEYAYAAADVVVCRAGATTLAELTLLGKASILIPYPYAAAGHQTFNAKTLADAGASVMIADQDVRTRLENELLALVENDDRRKKMSQASRSLGKPDAGNEIAQQILQLIVQE
jgi:UDP-N-acetylglucosamine--N-acetylmuramyl-(pentapeptide) pyrophosphoryl-undecaprenol N-acetylglucosamine transferase